MRNYPNLLVLSMPNIEIFQAHHERENIPIGLGGWVKVNKQTECNDVIYYIICYVMKSITTGQP